MKLVHPLGEAKEYVEYGSRSLGRLQAQRPEGGCA